MPKYQNIVGTGFPDFIQDQINVRSNIIGSDTRDGKILSYLNNRTGWFRMSSAAIVNGSEELARNNILQGGIVSRNNNNTINLKSTFNERYNKGSVDDLGLKPVPGITGLTIGTGGKWQTLQEAEVQFICHNLDQLNTISQLYMSLGINVFIEYGHLPYYDNKSNLKNKIDTINFFNDDNSPSGRDRLIKQITDKEISTEGNYGALLGMVSNFSYTANPDGSYTCSSKIIGPGHLAESLVANNSTGLFLMNEEEEGDSDSEKSRSDLEHAIHRLIEYAGNRLNSKNTRGIGSMVNSGQGYGRGSEELAPGYVENSENMKNGEFKYDEILHEIYNSSNLCMEGSVSFGKKGFLIKDDNLKYGNATQIVNGLSNADDNFDGLKPIGSDPNTESNAHFFDIIKLAEVVTSESSTYTYITLGHLFFLLNNFCLMTSEKGNDKATPLKLDFHPDNTVIKSGVIQGTVNPYVCIVPLKVGNKESWSKFFGGTVVNRLNLRGQLIKKHNINMQDNPKFLTNAYIISLFDPFTGKSNFKKNIANDPNKDKDKLSKLIDYININDENNNIKIFNVLVNLDMVLEVIKSQSDVRDDGKVFLLSLMNKILERISAALGGVNSLRTVVDEKNHVLRVVDEHNINNLKYNSKELITIPSFGKNSIAYEYNYVSQISPKIATQIVIASQALNDEGSGIDGGLKSIPEEIMSYSFFNGNVTDRFNSVYNKPISYKDDTDSIDKWEGKYAKLFDHLCNVYSLDFTANQQGVSIDFTKAYIDRQQISKNFDPAKNATTLMPLSLTIRLDGLSGIRPYSAFKIPNNRLPERYRNRIAFIVYSINHIFENNKWFTELVGNTIYVDENITPNDDRSYTEADKNPPKDITPEDAAKDLINAAYPQNPDGYSTAQSKPQGKADPLDSDKEESNLINPPSDGSQNNNQGGIPLDDSSTRGAPSFSSTGNDVIGATQLIKQGEGLRKTAYWDTTAYRIGYGSDTITSPNGSIRKVQKGDTITTSMAEADLNRRITQEFRNKAIQACRNNGVSYAGLPSCVQSVFIDIAYNYGTLWNSIVVAYRDRGKQGLINELKRRADQGPSQVPTRRNEEINFLQTRC